MMRRINATKQQHDKEEKRKAAQMQMGAWLPNMRTSAARGACCVARASLPHGARECALSCAPLPRTAARATVRFARAVRPGAPLPHVAAHAWCATHAVHSFRRARDHPCEPHVTHPRDAALNPEGKFVSSWRLIVLVFLLFTCFVVPLRLAFPEAFDDNPAVWDTFEVLIDTVFIATLVLNFFLGFYKEGRHAHRDEHTLTLTLSLSLTRHP